MKFYPDRSHPADVKVIHQGVDSMETSHISINLSDYTSKFQQFLYRLEKLKEEAQEVISFSQEQRFITHTFNKFGKFKVLAQGKGAYTYIIENEDVRFWIGTHKYGANDFATPQIKAEYRAHYLFSAGHKQAYNQVLQFINFYLGESKNLLQRIDLATDIQGIKYTSFDKYRLQTNYKKTDFREQKDIYIQDTVFREYLKHNKTTGFHIGNSDFLFRIYDKVLESKIRQGKSYVKTKWIANGYDPSKELPVWRHEIQYRRPELKKYQPQRLQEDEVLFHFSQLDKLWHNATQKVRWTDLSNDEIIRISEDELKSDSIKKIFQRARQNPERIDFWNILKNWDNKLAQKITKYKDVKEPKIDTAKKFYKAYLSSTYKALGNDPQNLIEVHNQVEQDVRDNLGITLQDFAEIKVLSSFVQNAKMIEETGYVYQMDYSKIAYHYFAQLQSSLKNIDKHTELKTARKYFEHNIEV